MADIEAGSSYPLGATVRSGGVNFSLYSRSATAVELVFFEAPDAAAPSRTVPLRAPAHRTFDYWHAFVPGIGVGQLYGYRVAGPDAPDRGLRFDGGKILLDPYARVVAGIECYDREAARAPGDNAAHCLKGVVADSGDYRWEGDAPLRRPFSQTVIYELHVGGFTKHPNSGVPSHERGTYAGLMAKIPYLQELGVTAVELLPVQQFDSADAPPGLVNYWGYSPVAFFAPHAGYSSRKDPLGPLDEFRDMVKALHRAGIEVILDVVFNHTAEGDQRGPTLSFRGLENPTYYIPGRDPSRYADYTGCGNTLNANHSVVRRMILECLRYWVREMHVDGFRFDLASVLSRDERGEPLANPPILWAIETDPVLAGTKIIAEAWDAAGLYQVGSFVGERWTEWNGHFRDDVRRFLKGDRGMTRSFAARLVGSPDIYPHEHHEPHRSINFVTCHDGFTVNDLVSYSEKHNRANGEGNRDGHDANHSWNCGVEGPTERAEVERLRNRQVKNFLTVTLFSLGTPMLLMGDEVRRTQRGNNNAYCQDNEISWFDWGLLARHGDVLRFARKLIRLRRAHGALRSERFWSVNEIMERAQVRWHGAVACHPDWGDDSHSLAVTLRSGMNGEFFHAIFNAFWQPLAFELPPVVPEGPVEWRLVIDTTLDPPDDIRDLAEAPVLPAKPAYPVGPRSVVVLNARRS